MKPNQANKIKIANGRDAILLSNINNYDLIQSNLEKLVGWLMMGIFTILILGAILLIAAETGWVIFIGVIFIPIGLFVAKLVGIPVYLILYELNKRL